MFKHLLSNNNDFYDFINSNLSLENSVSLIENPKPFYKNNQENILNLILILLFIALIVYLIHLFTKKYQQTL